MGLYKLLNIHNYSGVNSEGRGAIILNF